MTDNCDCLLCQKRKLHPELTPTPELVFQFHDTPRGPPSRDFILTDIMAPEPTKPAGRVELMQQIEEFTEFAVDGMSLDDSELASKTAAGIWATQPQLSAAIMWNFPVEAAISTGYTAPGSVFTIKEAVANVAKADSALHQALQKSIDEGLAKLHAVEAATGVRHVFVQDPDRAYGMKLVPADDRETHERMHAEARARLGLPPQYATSELVTVDCRECGQLLGSPEEFMAHECAAETNEDA